MSKENQIELNLIEQLKGLKYIHRPDIVDRKTLEQNFKAKFEELNRVHLTDNEFLRLREIRLTVSRGCYTYCTRYYKVIC